MTSLSKAERDALYKAQYLTPPSLEDSPVQQVVERIITDRLNNIEKQINKLHDFEPLEGGLWSSWLIRIDDVMDILRKEMK